MQVNVEGFPSLKGTKIKTVKPHMALFLALFLIWKVEDL